MKKSISTAICLTALFAAAAVHADGGTIGNGIATATSWVQGLKILGVAVAGLIGIVMVISGIKGIVNKGNSQLSPGQNFGMAMSGVVLVSLMAWIGIGLKDLGVTNSAASGSGVDSVFQSGN